MSYNWTCPHCERHVTIVDGKHSERTHTVSLPPDPLNYLEVTTILVTCPNPECEKVSLRVESVATRMTKTGTVPLQKARRGWNLIPESKAKHFPDYVPTPIIGDYIEACLIAELSPKASATLSRRCLQGMIHDFWNVATGNLAREIEIVKDRLDPETYGAIDAVRRIGNIGAHMEKDINLIVDVEPHEAELLIGLIETLIEEWYVARYERSKRMGAIKATAEAKKEIKEDVQVTPGEATTGSTLLTG